MKILLVYLKNKIFIIGHCTIYTLCQVNYVVTLSEV